MNKIKAIVYAFQAAASEAELKFICILTGITEKDKFVKCDVHPSMMLQSVAELPRILSD